MRVGLIVCLLLMTGCYFTKSAKVPMPAVYHAAANGEAQGLIVLLPGFGDGPKNFDRRGMIEAVRRIAPTFDAVATDAHFAYYRNRSIVERLHADVIEPIAHRYQRVWIVGISMGGAGAASYAMEHSDVVERVILLAPYVGPEEMISELRDAGGLSQWTMPDLGGVPDENTRHFYQVWGWLKGYTNVNHARPIMALGFGADDGLGRTNRLLADVLPSDQVEITPGGHKWTVWMPIFEILLRRAVAEIQHGA